VAATVYTHNGEIVGGTELMSWIQTETAGAPDLSDDFDLEELRWAG
jgi:hypothetical protein